MLGIVFEGVACRAAFHAGVAAELEAAGLPFAVAAGASSGSLCAAAIGAGRANELPVVFRTLAGRSIVSWRRLLVNRSPFDMSHLVRTTLEERFGGAIDLRARPIEVLVVGTRLLGLRRVVYSSHQEPDLLGPLLGSCFVPVLYGRHVRVRGELIVDGGVVDNLPIDAALARGCTEVIAVVAASDGSAWKGAGRGRYRPASPRARVHVIHPLAPLALRSWELHADRVAAAIDAGHEAARRFLG
jgi:NTE family protein